VAELSDGGIFALRVDAVVPPTLRPLDEVRAEAAEAWARARTAERLAGLGEDYQARLEAGESFADLGLEPTLEAGMARDGFIEGAPEGLVAAVFALPEGGIARMAGDDGLWLAQLTAVTPYDPTDPQTVTLRDVIRAQTSSAIANDLVTLYIQAEQDAAGLTLNQSAVAAVNAQFP
jgi:peptidyl-prolyl cis-trans isomerase D